MLVIVRIGATIGASLGSSIPLVGTVVGGIVGSLAGGLWGYYGSKLFMDWEKIRKRRINEKSAF